MQPLALLSDLGFLTDLVTLPVLIGAVMVVIVVVSGLAARIVDLVEAQWWRSR